MKINKIQSNLYYGTLALRDKQGKFLQGLIFTGKTRIEVITKALKELSLYQNDLLTI